MGKISTHALDTSHGKPAGGMRVEIHRISTQRTLIAELITDPGGRAETAWMTQTDAAPVLIEMIFHIGDYFRGRALQLEEPRFLDEVPVRFGVGTDPHYHVPLLFSPWSYSIYRGQ